MTFMKKGEGGFTLIEVLIALVIFALIGLAFFNGISAATKARLLTDVRETAKNLAEAEIEYLKNVPYDVIPSDWNYNLPSPPSPSWEPGHALPSGFEPFSLTVQGNTIDVTGDDIPESEIQKVTITVYNQGQEILTIDSYLVDL